MAYREVMPCLDGNAQTAKAGIVYPRSMLLIFGLWFCVPVFCFFSVPPFWSLLLSDSSVSLIHYCPFAFMHYLPFATIVTSLHTIHDDGIMEVRCLCLP